MSRLISLVAVLLLSACSTVEPLGNAAVAPLASCGEVKVYSSLEAAKAGGELEELCLISGSSAPGFNHTVGGAIEKNKGRACECGTDKVYVQAQDAGLLGSPSSVTLVAFRYKSP